jgi:hypothetical protein
MNVDILTIHPRSLDYPIHRAFLRKYEPYYNKAIIAFTGSGSPDYSDFVRNSVNPKKVLCINARPHQGSEDWRNVAVHDALAGSSSDWIWFLEQDFFFKPHFIDKLFRATNEFDAIGFWEANRLHPACLLVRRELINNSRKDFGIIPNELDHFGKFSQDIVAQLGKTRIGELEKLGLTMEQDWYHMQGLTHNFNLLRINDTGRIFKRDEFLTYAGLSLMNHEPVSKDYEKEVENAFKLLGKETEAKFLEEIIIQGVS